MSGGFEKLQSQLNKQYEESISFGRPEEKLKKVRPQIPQMPQRKKEPDVERKLFSCRLPQEMHDLMKDLRYRHGISYTDQVIEGIKLLQQKYSD